VTRKNRTNTRERIELMKYDPVLRRHVLFREER
jgi:large subunit ribosomal protein L33